MNNSDPADLDGDGEFDAIDIAILEEEKNRHASGKSNNGCCFSLTVISFLVISAIIGARFCLA